MERRSWSMDVVERMACIHNMRRVRLGVNYWRVGRCRTSRLVLPIFQPPRDVLPYEIELEVDAPTGGPILDHRVFVCIRTDGDGEILIAQASYREAHTVDGDRADRYDQMRKFRLEGDREQVAVLVHLDVLDDTCRVNVALHEVPVEAAAGGHRTFEVHAPPCLVFAQRRLRHRLLDGHDVERSILNMNNSLADAIHRDALIDAQLAGKRRLNPEAASLPAMLDIRHNTYGLADTGKHGLTDLI